VKSVVRDVSTGGRGHPPGRRVSKREADMTFEEWSRNRDLLPISQHELDAAAKDIVRHAHTADPRVRLIHSLLVEIARLRKEVDDITADYAEAVAVNVRMRREILGE
jgi:hypothetical protein